MAKPVVVDSDVLIDYFAGISPSAGAVRGLLQADRLGLTTLTVFELSCGADTEARQRDLALLVDAARVVLSLSVAAAQRAAEHFRILKTQGETLPAPDLLIAGCCLAAGLPLLTRNRKHFARIHGLDLADF